MREAGIHMIAVQSADGSLVVGDSHVYGNSPQPLAQDRIDAVILKAFDELSTCLVARLQAAGAAATPPPATGRC